MKARHKDTGEIIELAEEGIISRDGRKFCWYQVELIPEPIDECKPSLPSDLDEVAIPESEMAEWMKYGPHTNYPWCTVPDAIKITAEHFFALGKQAGAEWGSNHLRDSAKMAPDGLDEAAENIYKTPFGTRAEDFKAGAEWMAGQGWISVDEKLPEMDEEVIVLTDELGTAPIYKISFGHIVDVERCIDYNGWNIPGVKYWMPCPEIPKA